jgi:hypothetical protein
MLGIAHLSQPWWFTLRGWWIRSPDGTESVLVRLFFGSKSSPIKDKSSFDYKRVGAQRLEPWTR